MTIGLKINKQQVIIIVLICLLLLPNFCTLWLSSDLHGAALKQIAYISLSIGLALLPALVMRAKTYFIFMGCVSFVFAPIDIASLYLDRQPASSLFFISILSTDWHEACELVQSIWPVCIAVLVLWGLYIYLVTRVENHYLFGKKVRCGILALVAGLILSLYGSMCFLTYHMDGNKTGKEVLAKGWERTLLKYNKIFPCNIYRAFHRLILTQKEVRTARQEVEDFSFGITPINDSTLVILYIGETARYDHFQVNGYERPTTPNLSAYSNLISYTNVYSLANLTANVLPFIITRATPANPSVHYHEKSIVEAFAEAGYKTAYICNNCDYSYVLRIMNTCNYHYLFSKTFDADNNYDAELLPHIQAAYNQQCHMMVVHSLGSHFRYSMRYPHEDEYFTPAFGEYESYIHIHPDNREYIINAYDNSIRYTDKCLGELIDWVDHLDIPAIILYLSDHGESFWDDEHEYAMHGSYEPTEAEYHVPFMVWCSNEYKSAHNNQYMAMELNKDKKCSSNVVFSSLLDMVGIKECVDSSMSICSSLLHSCDTIEVLNGAGEVVKFEIP